MSANNTRLDGTVNEDLLKAINEAMQGVNFDNVDPDGNTFTEAPDGYYLCELKKAQFGFSKKGNLQVACQFKAVEDGCDLDVDKYGNVKVINIPKTKGKVFFKYYSYNAEDKILRFANDMAKFIDENNQPLLEAEAYKAGAEILIESLQLLEAAAPQIYCKQETSANDDGTSSTWFNPVSWNTAKKLGLPQ